MPVSGGVGVEGVAQIVFVLGLFNDLGEAFACRGDTSGGVTFLDTAACDSNAFIVVGYGRIGKFHIGNVT